MKAVQFDRYGDADVLQMAEVAKPTAKPGEVLVRVHAASVNPLDWKLRRGMVKVVTWTGLPRGVGTDFAGEIVALGDGVNTWRVGQRVFGSMNPLKKAGSMSEFITAPANEIVEVPQGMSNAEAATLCVAGGTALQTLQDKMHLSKGQRVLITGAAGGVGAYAVQIAHHIGAQVTGVCSTRNADMVKQLGANDVIDYAKQDFTQLKHVSFDHIFDAANVSSFNACRHLLGAQGAYVNTMPRPAMMLQAQWLALTSKQRLVPFMLKRDVKTWQQLAKLWQDGAIKLAQLNTVTFEIDAVRQAQRDSEAGHARGKTVVLMDSAAMSTA